MSSMSEMKRKAKLAMDEMFYEFGDAGYRNQAYPTLKRVTSMTHPMTIREAVDSAKDYIQYEFGYDNEVYKMLCDI